ncbi:hypothetical protein KJ039_11680 [bacterium]|nr:hypothetical protein [bacterium]
MENKKTKTRQELEAYLKSLLQFMLKSGQAYDMGFEGEAQRLAVALKAILDDPDGSGSLIEKIGLDLYFYDNCPDYDEKLALPMSGLALFAPSSKEKNRYVPRLGRNPGIAMNKAKFNEWWSKPVIVDDAKGVRLTRKDIVNAVSNTEAKGARPVLNEDFNKLLKENPIGWVDDKAGLKKEPLLGMEFASARHIAFEVLVSFEEQLPHYFEGLYPN